MLKFLFWNINRKPLLESITWLVHSHDIDVIILAESELDEIKLIKSLNLPGEACFSIMPPGLSRRIKIYSRFSSRFIKPIEDTGEISIRQIIQPIGLDIILVAVHLTSKLYQKESDQILNCTRLARKIEKVENIVGHTRTLIIGDLNMNPFECGIVGAEGIHAVSDRRIAERGKRKVEGEFRNFFYNPMWNHFGDKPPGTPGTYFYDTGTQVNYYWNIFDHVLIRPELISFFSDEDLIVVTKIGSRSILTKSGRPNKNLASDHLPILLSLKI